MAAFGLVPVNVNRIGQSGADNTEQDVACVCSFISARVRNRRSQSADCRTQMLRCVCNKSQTTIIITEYPRSQYRTEAIFMNRVFLFALNRYKVKSNLVS